MRHRRPMEVLLVVAALCLAPALSGCAAANHGNPRVLRVWLQDNPDPEIRQAYRDLAADFERRHPGVRVELSRIPYQQYREKLMLAVQGGTGPDVLGLDQVWTAELAAAGKIAKLDRFLGPGSGVDKDEYFSGAWRSNQWRGHTWGLPLSVGAWERMFYNADLFRRAGLDPDNPPSTWPEMLAAARRISQLPGRFGVGLIGCRDEASSVLTDSLIYSAGGDILSNGRVKFDSRANQRAYTMYQKLARYAPRGVAAACGEDVIAHFTAGMTGMVLAGGWEEAGISSAAKFDWRVATPPGPVGGRFVGALGGWNLAVNSEAPNKKLAFAFIRLASSSRTHQLAINSSVPALRQAGERFVRQNRTAPGKVLYLLQHSRPRPVTPVYPRISTAQQDAVQAILGGASVEDALDTAAASMQRAIDHP